jgi:hypothetical protein
MRKSNILFTNACLGIWRVCYLHSGRLRHPQQKASAKAGGVESCSPPIGYQTDTSVVFYLNCNFDLPELRFEQDDISPATTIFCR